MIINYSQKSDTFLDTFFVKLSKIKSQYFFIFLGFLSVFPLLVLSFFNNPASDDFDYEFKRPFSEIISTQIELYNGWSGRFFSIGFMAINPDVFIKYSFAKYYPFLIITLFVISLFWFFKLLFAKQSNLMIASLVGFFVFLFCFQVPDMCQVFFWYSSSICYQFGNVLCLVFVSSLIEYKKSKRIGFLFLAILSVIASIGSNEILMLIILFSSFWYVSIKYYFTQKIEVHEFFLLVIIILFSILVIVAPGNNTRLIREGDVANSHNFLLAFLKTVFYLAKYVFKWLPTILLTCYLFRDKIVEVLHSLKNNKVFIHPLLCFGLLLVIFFPCFFTGFWVKNYLLPDRALNSVYLFFLLFVLYFIGCLLNYFSNDFEIKNYISNRERVVISTILLFFTFSGTPISEAYFDLFSGNAYKYDKELLVRYQFIKSSNQKKIEVPILLNRPKTIYNSTLMGLTNDKNNWKNIEITKYFRKKSIVIQPIDSLLTE